MAVMTDEQTKGGAAPPAAVSEATPLLADDAGAPHSYSSQTNGSANGHREQPSRGSEGSSDDEPDEMSPQTKKMLGLLLPSVGIGLFLVAVDQLLTVAIYAKIGSELNALNNTSWVATSYFLTLTSFQPLYGKLSDIFGRKECLLFSYIVFAIGCLGCGLAQDMVQLCLARAVAGIGGGGMNSLVSILLSDLVPLRDRGVWQGYLNIIFAAGTSTGAPLGGLLADSIGWRWSFLMQVPLVAIAWLAVYFVLEVPPKSHQDWLTKLRSIDFLGAFTLIISVIAVLVGLDSGSNRGWSHIATIVSLALSVPLAAIFLLVEIKVASHPFAPGHIILHRDLLPAYLANFLGCAGMYGVLFFMPLYFQAVREVSAAKSGLFLVPATVASVIASISAGVIMRKTGKYYGITVCAFLLEAIAVLPLVLSIHFSFLPGEIIGLVMATLGGGCGITTTLIALLANAAQEDSAVVIACSYLFRSLGASVGISISSAVLQQTLRSQLAERFASGDEAREIEQRVRQSLDFIKELAPRLAYQVRVSYKMATMAAYIPTLVFLVIAFFASLWIREKPLKK